MAKAQGHSPQILASAKRLGMRYERAVAVWAARDRPVAAVDLLSRIERDLQGLRGMAQQPTDVDAAFLAGRQLIRTIRGLAGFPVVPTKAKGVY